MNEERRDRKKHYYKQRFVGLVRDFQILFLKKFFALRSRNH